jgi:hypothetical protein
LQGSLYAANAGVFQEIRAFKRDGASNGRAVPHPFKP